MRRLSKFLKKYLALLIVIAIVGVFSIVDLVNAKSYDMTLVSAYTTENTEKDPNKNYFSYYGEPYVTLEMSVRVTKKDKPCKDHVIAAVGENGTIFASRNVTDENGIVTFQLSVNFVEDDEEEKIQAGAYFFEESSAYVIEFRVDKTIMVDLFKRP